MRHPCYEISRLVDFVRTERVLPRKISWMFLAITGSKFLKVSNYVTTISSFYCCKKPEIIISKLLNMSQKWDGDEQDFQLYAETELRFEVAENSKASLQLKSGSAECFGTELMLNKRYMFKSKFKASVFTWHGCELTLSGCTSHTSVVKETPMVIYANVHAAIEDMRQKAETSGKKGPTVLVTGPKDVGKSTLCRILLNYAVRQGRKPIFVDLDVGQGQISIPGTVGAVQLESQIDLEDTFNQPTALVYHFGLRSPGQNMNLYNGLTSCIASKMNSRLENDYRASVSGIIINTCGWVKADGYRSITKTALLFEVDVILVLGQESLYKQLRKDMPSFVKIVFIPRSQSVFERSKEERVLARNSCVKEYFYGFKNHLHPHKFDVPFSSVKIYRIDSVDSSDSYFPPGTKFFDNQLCLVPVEIGYNLLNHLLSVSFATSSDNDVLETNVAGFVCVTNVNLQQQLLTIISPNPPPLTQNILLLSEVIFKI